MQQLFKYNAAGKTNVIDQETIIHTMLNELIQSLVKKY